MGHRLSVPKQFEVYSCIFVVVLSTFYTVHYTCRSLLIVWPFSRYLMNKSSWTSPNANAITLQATVAKFAGSYLLRLLPIWLFRAVIDLSFIHYYIPTKNLHSRQNSSGNHRHVIAFCPFWANAAPISKILLYGLPNRFCGLFNVVTGAFGTIGICPNDTYHAKLWHGRCLFSYKKQW